MSFQISTDQTGGETEGSSSSNMKPTLKQFVSEELGPIADLYNKLTTQVGITEIDELIFLDDNDTQELCAALKLSFGHKIKFKTAVRKLQAAFKPKQQQTIVTISAKEQAEIDKIDLAIKQSNDIQHLFEAHFNQIDDQIAQTKTQVDTEIDAIMQTLQNRKKSLHQKLDEWKIYKLENINKEIANIMEYHNELKKSKMGMNDLLRKSGSGTSKRDEKIKEIADKMFKNNDKFKVYQDMKLFQEYMVSNTKLIAVVFQEKMNMKKMQLFGELNQNLKSDIFNIPSILLHDVTKLNKDENGYNVKLEWELVSSEEHKSNGFLIEYALNDVVDNDDEKQIEMKYDLVDWMRLNDVDVQREENNKYSAQMQNVFKFDQKYQFRIQDFIQKPLNMTVRSNIKYIVVGGIGLDLSKEEHISMKIHSHKGHHDFYEPGRVLISNNDCYYSPQNQITNDWIIFDVNNNDTYYPTKLQVNVKGLDSGNGRSMKRFHLKVGSSHLNEWIELNGQIFTCSNTVKTLQTFNLDIVGNNNLSNRIAQKWKTIKSKNYQQFKLEILDNYGGSFIMIQEFKIFGVKI